VPRKRSDRREWESPNFITRSGLSKAHASIVNQTQHAVDFLSLLALDLAALAAKSDRALHARAFVRAVDAAHAAWRLAETLAEEEVCP
jgi:hypothetical protein